MNDVSLENDFIRMWDDFANTIQGENDKRQGCQHAIPSPYEPVHELVLRYLKNAPLKILDIGCETGKNAIPLLVKGHSVTLLDVSSKAMEHTISNIKVRGLLSGVSIAITCEIEDLPSIYNNYDAVVSTYLCSFIDPDTHIDVIKSNILDRIKPGGFFAGGFYGEEHECFGKTSHNFFTARQITALFHSMNFIILKLNSVIKKNYPVVKFNGEISTAMYHDYQVIAQRSIV